MKILDDLRNAISHDVRVNTFSDVKPAAIGVLSSQTTFNETPIRRRARLRMELGCEYDMTPGFEQRARELARQRLANYLYADVLEAIETALQAALGGDQDLTVRTLGALRGQLRGAATST